jgi:hypothetical protein
MKRLAVAAAAAVLGIGVAVAAVAFLDRDAGREPRRSPELTRHELSAARFLDSVGVVTHLSYVDTAYGRTADVLAKLRELGVRHIREAAPPPVGQLADALRQARAVGLKATVGTGDVGVDPAQTVRDSLGVLGDAVAAFEAPNELDNSGDPAWAAKLTDYMPRLATAVAEQAPGVPVIGPSLIDASHRGKLPADLPGLFNAHPYPGGLPPEPAVELALAERRASARNKKVVFTETGYHNALAAQVDQPPTSEAAAAVYIPRLLATAFGAGVQRTFLYELIDNRPDPGLGDPIQHWGLLRNDFSPKPAFTAVKTLIAAVRASPGPRTSGSLGWALRVDDGSRVDRVALVRPDGSLAIALWRPVSVWDRDVRRPEDPGTIPVELSFGGAGARDLTVWRPSVSPAPVLRRERADGLRLALAGDLVLISFR